MYNWLQPTSSFSHDCSIEVASGCWSKLDRLNSLQTQESCNLNWGHEKGAFHRNLQFLQFICLVVSGVGSTGGGRKDEERQLVGASERHKS